MIRLLLIGVLFFLTVVPLQAKTLTVGTSGTYATIAAAVQAASENDTIFIQNGVYHEGISTSKSGLHFQGESVEGVIWTSMAEAVGNPVWTKTPGYGNVYQCTASAALSGTVIGIVDDKYTGMYRRKGSLSDVDAIPGTLYSSGGLLYVHTSDGQSPNEHTLWYTSNAYGNTAYLTGGNYWFTNIQFIGATQFGIWIRSTSSKIGANTIENCLFRCVAAASVNGGVGVMCQVSDGPAGSLIVKDAAFLYNCSPVYDPNYSIFTDAHGALHPYQGTGIDTNSLADVEIEGCRFQFARQATGDGNSRNIRINRCLVTDISVHPHMHNMASNLTLRIENSIYSMYGSTTGPRSGNSSPGFTIYLINNTVYAGENPVLGSSDKMWFSATDSSTTVLPAAVYIYNNMFIRDKDAMSNNGQPLDLTSVPLDRINMDNNYYCYGQGVPAQVNDNFIRYGGQNFTLQEWKTYTSGRGQPKDQQSLYENNPDNVKLEVADYRDTRNTHFGKVQGDSPVVDRGAGIFAPAVDFAGSPRPAGSGPDIGAYEYVSGQGDSMPPQVPQGFRIISIQ